MNDRSVQKLSSSLLDMKFMIKTKKRLEAKEKKKKEMELAKALNVEPVEDAIEGNKYEICHDLTKLEDLLFGRMSFKGYNKEIENLMEYYERIRNGQLSDDDEEDEDGKDIKDSEMASSLCHTLSKKFNKRETAPQSNNESTSGRLNFKNHRKRGSGPDSEARSPKFMKPDY